MKNLFISIAGLGSGLMLLAALAFQYIGGLAPCALCIMQRWPHLAAVAIWLIWLKWRSPLLPWIGALAAGTTAAIGFFHMGVENGWWEYISACTQGMSGMLDMDALLDPSKVTAPLVRCDAIAWSFLGLSMAAWNGIGSSVLAILWLMGAAKRR